jgi:hypothetical protein
MKSQNIDIFSGFQTWYKKHVIFHRRWNETIKRVRLLTKLNKEVHSMERREKIILVWTLSQYIHFVAWLITKMQSPIFFLIFLSSFSCLYVLVSNISRACRGAAVAVSRFDWPRATGSAPPWPRSRFVCLKKKSPPGVPLYKFIQNSKNCPILILLVAMVFSQCLIAHIKSFLRLNNPL